MILQNIYKLHQEKMDNILKQQDELKNTTTTTTTIGYGIKNCDNQKITTNLENPFLMPTTLPPPSNIDIKNKLKQNRELRITKITTNRLKCKEFNDILSCYLCKGYLINPTTITNENCFHSFCRSCIITFIVNLSDRAYCPKCGKGTKTIKFSNLKNDESLKSIVYKLIPGLHHKELKRCLNFNTDKNIIKSQDLKELEEEDFFAPGEPISLSLEYHPKALGKGISNDQIPPIRYLQCPAALTVHHLKRFLCTKFDISPENQRVDIEIIYEDEVLANDFTLMDIGYCYKWKRTAPMRFFYQILIYNTIKCCGQIEDNVLNKEYEKNTEANKYSKTNEAVAKKTVKFKNVEGKAVENKLINCKSLTTTLEVKCKITNNKETTNLTLKDEANSDNNNIKENNEYDFGKSYNINNNTIYTNNNSSPNIILKDIKDKKSLKINLDNTLKKLEDMKTMYQNVIDSRHNDQQEAEILINPKTDKIDEKPITGLLKQTANSDFKSLRSNNEFQSQAQLNLNTTSKVKSSSPKSKEKLSIKTSLLDVNHQKSVSKCDIVVCIPQNHIHRASNSSDDSFENLSLAQLKTANKKNSNSISPRDNCGNFENETYDFIPKVSKGKDNKEKTTNRRDVPEKENGMAHGLEISKQDTLKVRIDKSSFKTKYSLSRKSNEKSEAKKVNKERKLSTDEILPPSNEVDLTTYAKVIGLKPIRPIQEEKRELIAKQSPDASPASATSSSSSASFTFSSEVSSSSSHKKRKKAKHSKELKELKKRKMHAEIAADTIDQPEGIKLKVKLTPSHKTHKTEKKLNGNDNQNLSKESKDKVEKIDEPISSTVKVNQNVQLENKLNIVEQVDQKTEKIEVDKIKATESNHTIKANEISEEKQTPVQDQNIAKPQHFVNSNKNKKQNFIPKTIATNTNPKFAASTAAASSASKTLNKNSLLTAQQNVNMLKQATQKMKTNSPDSNIPISPPLPPSLFKTQTLNIAKQNQVSPAVGNSQKNMITSQRPSMSQHQQLAMNQMNRLVSKNNASRSGTAANFIVPNPPRGIVSNASKHFPIGSIASQQHRQAAQLKRSASLDSSPPTFAKQLKIEQDRLIRKSASKLNNQTLPVSNHLQQNQQQNVILSNTAQQIINRNSPTAVVFSSVQTTKPPQEQIFYTSAMGPSYTHENPTKKPVPILLPPSSISVTKMVDTFPNSIITSPSGLTITPQDQQPPAFQFQNTNKPALEIVRIQSNIPPIDQQQFPILNNNTIKQTNKASRPPPPPIPLRIRKPISQSQPTQPLLSTVASSIPQNAQLLNISQIISNKTENTDNKPIEILDLSGKSRSPSREKSLSPENPTVAQDILQNNAANLEAALNQLLQQQNHVTSSSGLIAQSSKSPNEKVNQEENVGLQNLQMLSESALNREKLAVKTNRAIPMLSKLDVGKIRANANVRHQNASIRNIPNPSALAFRGTQQPPMPILTNLSKSPQQQKLNLNLNENIPKTQALNSNISTAALSPTTTTTIADSSKLIASKKNLEQLAQNLNMRAAAAADNSAKNSFTGSKVSGASSPSINSLVTSTTTDNKNNAASPNSFNVTSSTSSSISSNLA